MNLSSKNLKSRKAIITGITGQDGAYLASFLLEKGYQVYGAFRRTASTNFWRLEELNCMHNPNLCLIEHDLTDLGNAIRMLEKIEPDEVYNLAAQSFVGVSFEQPMTTGIITGLGVVNLLEAIRVVNPKIRFYQASSSEMFGSVQEVPQTEKTPFYPRSPYACAKLYAHWMTINYRESFGIFGSCGILFNHESPLRGLEFVTRKITNGLARVKLGKLSHIELGNLEAERDWGFAKDYVEGMWKMLQIEEPKSYVLATNKTSRVRDFVKISCKVLNLNIEWQGKGTDEIGIDKLTGQTIIKINPNLYRPAEVDMLIGDPSKAKKELNWEASTTLEQLCNMMVNEDINRIKNGSSF